MINDLNNIERISETLDSEYHKMQHFIIDSNWNVCSVMDQVFKDVARSLPKQTLTGLLIDESGLVKKGNKSVGVGYQHFGNEGKTANSQVADFGCLCNGKHASLVDSRLHLPKSLTANNKRCDEAGVHTDKRIFKINQELAIYIEVVKSRLLKRKNDDAMYLIINK
jgi:SRSO17 transposase